MDSSAQPATNSEYSSSGFFVLRTPLLPFDEFLKLSRSAAGTSSNTAADRACVRAHLREWLARPEVQEALWLASPELVQSLRFWRDDPDGAKGRRLEHALYRYLARMTARATPFGAFAGCSVGEIAAATRLDLGPSSGYRRATRLDMEYLCNLAESISADPARRGQIRFRCNSSLHLAAGRYHHLRGEWRDGTRVFLLVATDPTPALDATFLRATPGATADSLAAALVESDREITRPDADAFIARLIESELLVSDLFPPVTGPAPVYSMASLLEQAGLPTARELRSIDEKLLALDQGGLGAEPGVYEGIAAATSRLGCESKPGRLLQMDLIKPVAAASVSQELVNEILQAIATLHSIRADSVQTSLAPFMEQFQERYQEREVPLLEALDDEAGIGFENEDNPTSEPLIAGIDFRPSPNAPTEDAEDADSEPPDAAASALSRRVEALRANRGLVLELDLELIEELKVADPLPLPGAFSAMGVFFRAPDGRQGFYLQSVAGPSGANLAARFCHADERLAQCVQDHVRAEEAFQPKGAVFAEIAHLPEGRIGNVVCRPALRRYEIPFLATPGVPPERRIALADLTVSRRGGRIVLRSRRLGCEVLPRLTSAHNFSHPRSLKLYKFLCLLQHQGTCPELAWHWSGLDDGTIAFLPRVAMANMVFSPARWRITRVTAPELFAAGGAAGERGLDAWRAAHYVPRFAFIAEADNQLLIDFENVLGVETFFEHIRKNAETLLIEMFPAPGDLAVRGPEGSFVHEMILPFVSTKPMPAGAAPAKAVGPSRAPSPEQPLVPTLAPRAEWLFAKLYASPSHADRLLLELVRPLLAEAGEPGHRWFFLRYGDPHWHLRLRFHGAPAYLRERALPALLERARPFERQGILWRLNFDDYEPELERYGGPQGIGVAEQMFLWSSELCLELLPLVTNDSGADLRWQLALAGSVRLLSALGFGLAEMKTLAEQLRDAREQLWIADEGYRRQLARKFRSGDLRRTIDAIVDESSGGAGDAAGGSALFPKEAAPALQRFSGRLHPIREQLRALDQSGQLTASLADLAASYVHMHLNRMLRSCHLEQEAVLCDFLARACAAPPGEKRPLRRS